MARTRDSLGGLLLDVELAEQVLEKCLDDVAQAQAVAKKASDKLSAAKALAFHELSKADRDTVHITSRYAWLIQDGYLAKYPIKDAWAVKLPILPPASEVEPDFPTVEPATNGHLIGHPLACHAVPPAAELEAEMAEAFAFPEIHRPAVAPY